MELMLIVISCLLFAGLSLFVYKDTHKYKRKEQTKISFKEGLDLTDLPIVTFYQGDKKLHFLLDTGSNISYINKEVLDTIEATDLNSASSTYGVEGNGIETRHYAIQIGYKDQRFTEEFGAVDLSGAFSAIEEESGVKLHGIIGNKFFEKYKYILDFKELIAYR